MTRSRLTRIARCPSMLLRNNRLAMMRPVKPSVPSLKPFFSRRGNIIRRWRSDGAVNHLGRGKIKGDDNAVVGLPNSFGYQDRGHCRRVFKNSQLESPCRIAARFAKSRGTRIVSGKRDAWLFERMHAACIRDRERPERIRRERCIEEKKTCLTWSRGETRKKASNTSTGFYEASV